VLVHGTDGLKSAANWWRPASPFVSMLHYHGRTLLDEADPFWWSGVLGGTTAAPPYNPDDAWARDRRLVLWSDAGMKLRWYLDAKAHGEPVDVVCHSHGGAVLVFALLYGAKIRNVVSVSSPIRNDMLVHRAEATKRLLGRLLHFFDNTDMTQAEGCIGDGLYPLILNRLWPEPALCVEQAGNGHSKMLYESPAMFEAAGGIEALA
jgi:hypothetical protein